MTGRGCRSASHSTSGHWVAGSAHEAVGHREAHAQAHTVRCPAASFIFGGRLHGVKKVVATGQRQRQLNHFPAFAVQQAGTGTARVP